MVFIPEYFKMGGKKKGDGITPMCHGKRTLIPLSSSARLRPHSISRSGNRFVRGVYILFLLFNDDGHHPSPRLSTLEKSRNADWRQVSSFIRLQRRVKDNAHGASLPSLHTRCLSEPYSEILLSARDSNDAGAKQPNARTSKSFED